MLANLNVLLRWVFVSVLGLGLVISSAWAQDDITLNVERIGAAARIIVAYPEAAGGNITASAEVAAGSVLLVTFSDPVTLDPEVIREAAPDLVSGGRLDENGTTLRFALNRPIEPQIQVSHNLVILDLLMPGMAPLPEVTAPYIVAQRQAAAEARRRAEEAANRVEPPLDVTYRLGTGPDYTRLEFFWPENVTYALEDTDQGARLSFERGANLDLRELTSNPPARFNALRVSQDNPFVLDLEFDESFNPRVSTTPDSIILDLMDPGSGSTQQVIEALSQYANQREADLAAAREAEAAAAREAEEVARRANEPTPLIPEAIEEPANNADAILPPGGLVRAEARYAGDDVTISFPFAALPGAAVFRRNEDLWVVFDVPAQLNLAELGVGGRQHIRGFEALLGEDYAVAKIETSPSTLVEVSHQGPRWQIHLTESLEAPTQPMIIRREDSLGEPGRLRVRFNGAHGVRRVQDPIVGDEILVLTGNGATRGILARRQYLEAQILPSTHGLALLPLADDLVMQVTPEGAIITRPGGLALSRQATQGSSNLASRPVSPAFLDFARWRGTQRFARAEDARLREVALNNTPEDYVRLAQFYMGWGLAAEALGAARIAKSMEPRLDTDAGLRALEGAASLKMGRVDDAARFFNEPSLRTDPAAQIWRGLIAAQNSDWPEARRHFEAGADTVYFYEPQWRARFRVAHARAALEANDLSAAASLLSAIQADDPDMRTQAEAELIAARLEAGNGQRERAITRLNRLARHPWEPIQAEALLHKTQIQIDAGEITPQEGIDALEALRFRWRGDMTEMMATRLLGQLYAQAGRHAEALELLSAAQTRDPDSIVSRRMLADMDQIFRGLFLEDGANNLDPIEALALYYEYSALTPQSADGDRMLRRLADRLVAFDLLGQAAELLQYQIEERPMPAQAKAAIAADLAVIYLMDERPGDAIAAIRSTRVAGTPRDVVDERRVLEARALAELGRTDHALELIQGDTTRGAFRMRADIAWQERDWAQAGRRLEALLGDRWQDREPLTSVEAHDVLRAAIAYSLVNDRNSVNRLQSQYAQLMGETEHAAAFSVLGHDSITSGDTRLIDMVNELASFEGLDAFMSEFATRFEDTPT